MDHSYVPTERPLVRRAQAPSRACPCEGGDWPKATAGGGAERVLYGAEHGATFPVVENGAPSTSIRCMITASLRANATEAFLIPPRSTSRIA